VGRLIAPALAERPLAGAGLVLVEWTADPSAPGPPRHIAPLHVHHRDDEAWYVLAGALRFRLGDDEVEAGPGGAVLAPRGIPHTYWNPGAVAARYVLVLTPNLHRLIEALHAEHDDMDAVFRAHASESLGWLQP
jgi:mannose-6-phosphate isomerase-like protein (cupin superfamily)